MLHKNVGHVYPELTIISDFWTSSTLTHININCTAVLFCSAVGQCYSVLLVLQCCAAVLCCMACTPLPGRVYQATDICFLGGCDNVNTGRQATEIQPYANMCPLPPSHNPFPHLLHPSSPHTVILSAIEILEIVGFNTKLLAIKCLKFRVNTKFVLGLP